MAHILVVAEHQNGALKKATLSSVTFAREVIAKQGGSFDILVAGANPDPIAAKLLEYGAKTVHTVKDAGLEPYVGAAWSQVVASAAKACGATHVVGAATSVGKDLMPRVAVRLETGMASDVIGFGKDSNYIRPMWAGNVLGEVQINGPVHVVTVRSTDFGAAAPSGGASPVAALAISVDASKIRTRVVEAKQNVSDRPELTEARVVVAGGRGLKSKENFKLVEDFAKLFNAALGATRAAVDAEYIENDAQIGQTGKSVAPDLYFAFGISGAIQHLAGMKNSKIIVAVNKDEEAPIFQVADYGLVGDLFKVIPEMTELLKSRR